METTQTAEYYKAIAKHLEERSKEICQDNHCTEDEHNCGSYAYFNALDNGGYELATICLPDYCQKCYDTMVSLPFDGDHQDLLSELEYNLFD